MYNVTQGAQIIDINMGCPAKRCRRAAGSALLADERWVAAHPDRGQRRGGCTGHPENPHRLGARRPQRRAHRPDRRGRWDRGPGGARSQPRLRVSRAGRYDTIAAIVAATRFPVFANGDIDSPRKAAAVLAQTGRGGRDGPAGAGPGCAARLPPTWRGRRHAGGSPPPRNSLSSSGHLISHCTLYGEFHGVRIARKHVGLVPAGRRGESAPCAIQPCRCRPEQLESCGNR